MSLLSLPLEVLFTLKLLDLSHVNSAGTRYLMYPIALILILSLFKKDLYKFGFISLGGLFVSLYHIYLQNGGGGGGSCAVDIPCNLKYVDILGFISIPVMGATGFLTIFISLLYYDYARRQNIE